MTNSRSLSPLLVVASLLACGVFVDGPAPGLRLHALDSGDPGGEPVVFVHGFANDAASWAAPVRQVNAAGRRAIALELRGHGESTPPANDDYAIAALADDVATVVDALALPRFVLVGQSMGAAVAGEYAGRHPDRVSALVLEDRLRSHPRGRGG